MVLTSGRRRASVRCQVTSGIVGFMNRIKNLLTALICAVTALTFTSSLAGAGDKKKSEHDAIREALQRGETLPLARILVIAQEAVAGDVIEVELERENDRLIYEIKVLTATGRVREVEVDARTGAVLKIEDD
jgi:uncharacterized membrane protein YkoI